MYRQFITYRELMFERFGEPSAVYLSRTLIAILTAPEVVLAFGILFVAIFSFMLNGVTPLVSFILRLRGPLQASQLELHYPRDDGVTETTGMPTTRSAQELVQKLDQTDAPSPLLPVDPIEHDFANYIVRSQEAARVAQRRPNALLFVGAIIAAAGLIFFVMTLPGSRYGFLDATPPSAPDLKSDFWASMIQLLPRLLMLIFIQVLAGFFLRQYRSSMEDFRYYESILRHREAQYLSYTLRKKMDDKKALLKFADELLKEQDFGRISKGQSTTVLEAQKAELNEFSTLYEKFASLFARAEKTTKEKT